MTEKKANLRDLKTGLTLLLSILSGYRSIAVVSIVGAMIWTAMIVVIPYLVGSIVDEAVTAVDPLGDDGRTLADLARYVLERDR